MFQMTIEMPEEALAALRKDPEDFARELRLVAAVKMLKRLIEAALLRGSDTC